MAGLYFYFGTQAGKQYRLIGWMYVIPFLIYLFTQGRSYYQATCLSYVDRRGRGHLAELA